MAIEGTYSISGPKEHGVTNSQANHIEDIVARPWIVLLLLGSVSLLIGTAIRLTRYSLSSEIESFHRLESNNSKICKRFISIEKLCAWKNFCLRKLPRRIWNFYIEAFLVPGYRKEWGNYKNWSFKAPTRHTQPEHIQEHLNRQKLLDKKQKQFNKAPRPVPHFHPGCERIRLNISGVRYETQLRTLERFPNTLLGNSQKRLAYFNPTTSEYYFDRCRTTFETILYFYQSGGRFKRPGNIAVDVLLQEAHFFELGDTVITKFQEDEGICQPATRHEVLPQNLLRRKIWLLFEAPESSTQAGLITFVSTVALFVSIGTLCIESMQTFYLKASYGVNKTSGMVAASFDGTDILDPFVFTEAACNVWFMFEFLARLFSCPRIGKFASTMINLIDLLAVLPFMVTTSVPFISKQLNLTIELDDGGIINDDGVSSSDYLYLLRIIRIVRVFRIFKLSRQMKGLKILGKTIKESLNELMLLIFFIIIGMILFSSTMYFAELDDEYTDFHSIPGGFWWALITLTTVGYGDVVPKTPMGKVVGALCAVTGIMVIALPVPVIVTNFNYFYYQAVDEIDLKWININFVSSCPFRPASETAKNREGAADSFDNYSSDEDFSSLKKTNVKNRKANK